MIGQVQAGCHLTVLSSLIEPIQALNTRSYHMLYSCCCARVVVVVVVCSYCCRGGVSVLFSCSWCVCARGVAPHGVVVVVVVCVCCTHGVVLLVLMHIYI